MPFVDDAPFPPPSPLPRPVPIRITDPQYRGIAIDNRYIPATDLLTHVEGSSWTVDYYSQVLERDTTILGQSPHKPPQFQQYRRVRHLELKVTQPLAATQEPNTKKMGYKGGANLYPVLIPNQGDVFVAQVDDGRCGVFNLTSTERKSFYKDSVYAIEYEMLDYATPERLRDLEVKTIQRLEYVRDYLQCGQNPLVEEALWQKLGKLRGRFDSILATWMQQFMSDEFMTVLVPGQPWATYDAWLVRALTELFPTTASTRLAAMLQLNCDGDPSMACVQLWDVLVKKDPALLRFANPRAGLLWATRFTRNPMFNGIRWSGIERVVYPVDVEMTVDQELAGLVPLADDGLNETTSRAGRLEDLIAVETLSGLPYAGAPLIYPVLCDDCYVLSRHFYENDAHQSRLELLVREYLEGRVIAPDLLAVFCDTWHGWGALERFYYTPIVLLLIRAALHRV
ncbi:hypothetical protein [Paraburkholderia adhaesiva]|uniref:hypothetical protein n=1 Tax=Paraburkholderia adhaesiva TaxID=2883244 RepID=UPI001F2596A4|nr:hypothetical protein [Paraburkholderia adhaesiva]